MGGDEGTVLKHKLKASEKEPSNQQEAKIWHNESM